MTRSIAAIVPTYNRKAKTLRFVEAWLKQTYSDSALVLVDAGSQDGTLEAVRDRMPQAHLLSVSEACYWSAATNAGIEFAIAQGYDYILTINDDCLIEPDYLDTLVRIAQTHQAPIVGSRIDYLSAPGLIWTLGLTVNWRQHLSRQTAQNHQFTDLPLDVQQADLIPTDMLAGNGVLIERQVFETIGLYQAQYLPHYLADVEWTLRAQKAGFPVTVTPQAIVYNDDPTPAELNRLLASSTQPVQAPLLSALRYRLFHVRSGENLMAKCYLIWHHCPTTLKPWAFLRRFASILTWSAHYLQARTKSKRLSKSAPSENHCDRSNTLTRTP